jgi:hypothetical protein
LWLGRTDVWVQRDSLKGLAPLAIPIQAGVFSLVFTATTHVF